MKIIFARNKHWISRWIQSETWSRWSHVGIVDGVHVIEAKGIAVWPMLLVLLGLKKNSIKLGGVVKTPLSEFLIKYKKVQYAYIDGDIEKARALVGIAMFDPWGLIGIYLKRRIDCHDKFFCAKLVAYCATHYRDRFIHRATAQKILEISRDEE